MRFGLLDAERCDVDLADQYVEAFGWTDVGQLEAHVVQQEVGVGRHQATLALERGHVARSASDVAEQLGS